MRSAKTWKLSNATVTGSPANGEAGEVVGGEDVTLTRQTKRPGRSRRRKQPLGGRQVRAVRLARLQLPADAVDVVRRAGDHQAHPDSVLGWPGDEIEVHLRVEITVGEATRLAADVEIVLGSGSHVHRQDPAALREVDQARLV